MDRLDTSGPCACGAAPGTGGPPLPDSGTALAVFVAFIRGGAIVGCRWPDTRSRAPPNPTGGGVRTRNSRVPCAACCCSLACNSRDRVAIAPWIRFISTARAPQLEQGYVPTAALLSGYAAKHAE